MDSYALHFCGSERERDKKKIRRKIIIIVTKGVGGLGYTESKA